MTRPQIRLFCFPYAGGSSSIYRSWANIIDERIEVVGVQYPGRVGSVAEKPCDTMEELIWTCQKQIGKYSDLPICLFGHSMGAMVVYELSHKLQSLGIDLKYIFLSGVQPPHIRQLGKPIHLMPKPQFIEEISGLGGTPIEVLRDPSFMELIVPRLRADLKIAYEWQDLSSAPLLVPASILGGTEDFKESNLKQWAKYFATHPRMQFFEGGHFFINQQSPSIVRYINQILLPYLES